MRTTDAAAPRIAKLLAAVASEGGIVRRRRMTDARHSQRTIAEAVQSGALLQIRRVWIALPGADADLISAARTGVVVSCVTQARRLGLWVDGGASLRHVAVSARSGRVPAGAATRVHRAAPLIPRDPNALEDSLENALALVCVCQPFESALAIVESALDKKLVRKQQLLRLPLPAGVRRVVDAASPFSNSGLETLVVPRLRWLRLRIVPQAWIAGHRVDFLIGERLVFQIDGGHHVGRQRASDNEHDAILRHLGYHVIRVGYIQMIEDWPGVQALIMQAVAQGLHLPGRS